MARTLNISTALRKASRLKRELGSLDSRLPGAASWQDGVERDFDFAELLARRDELSAELVALKAAIAKASANFMVDYDGRQVSLTYLIRLADEKKGRIALIQRLSLRYGEEKVQVWDEETGERRVQTVIWQAAMKRAEQVEEIEGLQREIDEINDLLDASNARAELDL